MCVYMLHHFDGAFLYNIGVFCCNQAHDEIPAPKVPPPLLREQCLCQSNGWCCFCDFLSHVPFYLGCCPKGVVPVNTSENHPPTEAYMIIQNSMGCRIQDPGTRGYWWWKIADFSLSALGDHTTLCTVQCTVRHSTAQHTTAQCSTVQYSTVPARRWRTAGEYHKNPHFVRKSPPFWLKLYQKTPQLKCAKKHPKMCQNPPPPMASCQPPPPQGGVWYHFWGCMGFFCTFWGVFFAFGGGFFGTLLGVFSTFWGGFGTFRGVFWYISGAFMVFFLGVSVQLGGCCGAMRGGLWYSSGGLKYTYTSVAYIEKTAIFFG